MIGLLLHIAIWNIAGAQTLSWSEPKADEKTKPSGYRILYELGPAWNKCGTYDEKHRPRYSLDLGKVFKYDLSQDANFQIGFTYYIAVVAYSIDPIKDNEKDIGYKILESKIANSACVVIRDVPEGLDNINNEETENEEINYELGPIGERASVSADGDGGQYSGDVDAQRPGRYGDSVNNSGDAVPTLLGTEYGHDFIERDFNRSTAPRVGERSKRGNNLPTKYVERGLVERHPILFSNDSKNSDSIGRSRVDKIDADSLQDDAEITTPGRERNSSIINYLVAAFIGAAAVVFKGIA